MSSRIKLFIVCLLCSNTGFTLPAPADITWRLSSDTIWRLPPNTGHVSSTPEQALLLLRNTKLPDSSIWWPNVKLSLFIENLKANINFPLKIYQGSNTNFCGYAALSYLPLQDDPLSYTRFMLSLYLDGKATWNNISFETSPAIHQAAGTLHFKGILDIRHADQIWFLILADHFRSYLNFFNRRFHPGSEDTFWAAVNYGKFNRMIRQLLGWQVEARGSDVLRPHIPHLFDYLTNCLTTGTTYLYVNNTYLHKKNHNKFKSRFPTHYIVLEQIHRIPGQEDWVDIVYWDYGGRTLRQMDLHFLKRILFGVSHCTPPTDNK
ncbi:hypothetical protein [Puia dinghuensis]|uniref:Uncharacterized protein n=1 Tax=Puia dinghuensis TaxID=1792502 RepID=A0A8J2UHN5_9BACT|nr:hypothetical protein [Puia dinghuensis]GGB17131.1 hypothetical protein GCM10011511_46140 [Puia dinghuensis]